MAKILVNVWTPLIGGLRKKTDAACMKRDVYLDKVLLHEAGKLREEMKRQNSNDARDHIATHLGLLKPKPVNLLLSEGTADLIGKVCKLKNVPRDAFINRTLLFLVIRPSFFPILYSEFDWDWARETFIEKYTFDQKYLLYTPNLLDAIGEIVQGDPFWYIRECINVAWEHDNDVPLLHEKFIKKDALGKLAESAVGFNCYLDDANIEGHPAAKARAELAERLLDELCKDTEDNLEKSK